MVAKRRHCSVKVTSLCHVGISAYAAFFGSVFKQKYVIFNEELEKNPLWCEGMIEKSVARIMRLAHPFPSSNS